MKASIVAASAALVGSVAAAQHNGHAGFHVRRGAYAETEDVCTVYTTVYVTALPPMAANSTVYEPSQVPQTSSSCTEEETTSVYTPPTVYSTAQSPPAAPQSSSSSPADTTSAYTTPAVYSTVPQTSSSSIEETSSVFTPVVYSTIPSAPPAPQTSTTPEAETSVYTPPAVYSTAQSPPPAAETSSTCTEEETSSVLTPPAVYSTTQSPPALETSSTTPEAETSIYTPPAVYSSVQSPPAPETSSTCTEETSSVYTPPVVYSTNVPATSSQGYSPAPVPESSKVVYSSVPVVASSSAPKPTTPAYTPVPESSKMVYPSVPVVESSKPVSKSTTPAYTPQPSSSKAIATPSSSKTSETSKPTGSYSEGGRIVTNGDKWAMTYTPYAADGNCKTADEVKSDIKVIADLGFTTIRSYSTDCGVFENVVPECEKYGLKVIYGVFLDAGGKGGKGCFSDYANKQVTDIVENAPKAGVAMVIVGNECMFKGNCQPAELASYIDYVREQLTGAGFPTDIAITTTEPVNIWQEMGAALCDHIDVFACQVHPYFTATISADMAGDFAASQLELAAKVCPDAAKKGKYISEIGWPSAGLSNGLAIAGVDQQKVAMKKIMEKVGSEATIFSFNDDPWKVPGDLGVEQHFGCADVLA
ncbi:glycoside hydrolase family 17 protein [Dothidotthia symphoricarpi CBS 119687]|uniref:Probable beta-glucosidase btgE n=1 Tax=Dothidotthia symphoricarpi CBS 119687 TaxID=1392245 RepID=A0A6A6APR4_9PLEO|nr:glycoside hydrolase family 17 protein [Dothidotthia symphoricarpi CBS 119687]KAF2132934.1 glycoside hydrolase family 17 protein [Dothidotthia symphoricarpi CBS 119687]